MENDNSTKNNLKINETEAYFDLLLKKQSTESAVVKKSSFKPFSVLFVFVVVIIGLYFAVNYYITGTTPIEPPTETTSTAAGGYFNPEYYTQTGRTMTGRISKPMFEIDDPRRSFELLSNDGKTTAYIYSNSHDLNLSLGLDVEIQGRFSGTTTEGIEIIEVSSIKLK